MLAFIIFLFLTVPGLRHSIGLYGPSWYQTTFTLDPDGDNIPTKDCRYLDRCPHEREDVDGFQDYDGCPDPDNDQDGTLDVNDRCPMVPGSIDNQGCPKAPPPPKPVKDTDGDGILDPNDACPTVKEDYNGFSDEDGCPDGETGSCSRPSTLDKFKLWKE